MSRYNRNIPSLKDEDLRSIQECLEADASRRKSFFPEDPLLIVIDGTQRSFDPCRRRKFQLEVDVENRWIEVLARTASKDAKSDDLPLASYLYCYDEVPEDGQKIKYSTLLEGGQKINFTVYFKKRESGDEVPVVDISYQETRIFRALLLLWRRLKNGLRELMMPDGIGQPVPGAVAGGPVLARRMAYPIVLALFLIALALPVTLFIRGQETPTVAEHRGAGTVIKDDYANGYGSDASQYAKTESSSSSSDDDDSQFAYVKPKVSTAYRRSSGRAKVVSNTSSPPKQRLSVSLAYQVSMQRELVMSYSVTGSRPTASPSPAGVATPAPENSPTPDVYAEQYDEAMAELQGRRFGASLWPDAPQPLKVSIRQGLVFNRNADGFILIMGEPANQQVQLRASKTVQLSDSTEVFDKAASTPGSEKYPMTRLLPGTYAQVQVETRDSGELVARKINILPSPISIIWNLKNLPEPMMTYEVWSTAAVRGAYRNTKVNLLTRQSGKPSPKRDISRKPLPDREVTELGKALRLLSAASAISSGPANVSTAAATASAASSSTYTPRSTVVVTFRPGSAELSDHATRRLTDFFRTVRAEKDYMVNVIGFAGPQSNAAMTNVLIQQRKDAVVTNLIKNQQLSLTQILMPDTGDLSQVRTSQQTTAEQASDRVEVKIIRK